MAFTGFHHHKDLKIQRWGIYKKKFKNGYNRIHIYGYSISKIKYNAKNLKTFRGFTL